MIEWFSRACIMLAEREDVTNESFSVLIEGKIQWYAVQ